MEAIRTSWPIQNEYARPLEGQPSYRSSGIIYALDPCGSKYAVSRVDHERFGEQDFQYVFTPEWAVIDALPASIFQGIPGLDLSLRLERYYRVNMTPVFISERTPSEGREDLWELLDSVGLDYYDRFEWLLRTRMRCGTDNLIVERAREEGIRLSCDQTILSQLQPADTVTLPDLPSAGSSARELSNNLLCILRSGAQIHLEQEERTLSPEERSAMLKLLLIQQSKDRQTHQEHRIAGIRQAKENGKYTGRKKQAIDPTLLREVAQEFHEQKISEQAAMERLGIRSRSTLYRRLREIKTP